MRLVQTHYVKHDSLIGWIDSKELETITKVCAFFITKNNFLSHFTTSMMC